jgi:hypothetical protein
MSSKENGMASSRESVGGFSDNQGTSEEREVRPNMEELLCKALIAVPPTPILRIFRLFILNWRSHVTALCVAFVAGTGSLLIGVGSVLFSGNFVSPYKYPLVYLIAYLASLITSFLVFLRVRGAFIKPR